MINRRRDGRVANSHLANTEEIDLARDRLHSIGEGRRCRGRVHRRLFGDVLRRNVEGEFEYLQAETESRADLVDRRAPGGEILHHGARHRGRIGRDALGGDAVVGGENRHQRAIERRRGLTLPGREERDDVLQLAERALRLGQLRLARADRGGGAFRALRHERNQIADGIERRDFGKHGGGLESETGVDAVLRFVAIVHRPFCRTVDKPLGKASYSKSK